jgi:hypothetical protein
MLRFWSMFTWMKLPKYHSVPLSKEDPNWCVSSFLAGILVLVPDRFLPYIQPLSHRIQEVISTVWKIWPTCKAKLFAWLQNRVCTADWLRNCGWPNCGICQLFKQTTKWVHHLFVDCFFFAHKKGSEDLGGASIQNHVAGKDPWHLLPYET